MRWIASLQIVLVFALCGDARAADRADDFDYYVLSLSWNAAWCETEGAGRGAPQCAPFRGIGFILHGLWPQYEDGWPENCRTTASDPSRNETAAMADIMGSGGLAWHQWKKHGRCTGLEPAEYFARARAAWDSIRRPEILREVRLPRRIAPRVIEQAFLEANPSLTAASVTVTCSGRHFREVRICLDRDLAPRDCTGPVAQECPLSDPLFVPMR